MTLPPRGEELVAFCRRFRLFDGGDELTPAETSGLVVEFEFRSKSSIGGSKVVLNPDKPNHVRVHGTIRLGGYETTLVIVPRGGGSKAVRATAFEPLG